MQSKAHHTALLFFTKSAASEAASKSFVEKSRKRVNRTISSFLINSTRKTALSSNLPFFEIDDRHQTGDSFGERLGNAIAEVFEKDFDKVIVIGNDCPQLTADIIWAAETKLATYSIVTGPDQHGGAYLIGITKDNFDKVTFAGCNWCSSDLLSDLQAIYSHTSYFQLPTLKDVNNLEDLKFVNSLLPFNSIIRNLITSVIVSYNTLFSQIYIAYINPAFYLFGLRAPPRL